MYEVANKWDLIGFVRLGRVQFCRRVIHLIRSVMRIVKFVHGRSIVHTSDVSTFLSVDINVAIYQ